MSLELPDTIEFESNDGYTVNLSISQNLWEKVKWELEDNVLLIPCEEYDDSGNFSHYTITIERVMDINKNKKWSKK